MVIPGVIVSVGAAVIANFFGSSKYDFEIQKRSKLTDDEIKVLDIIRKGYNTMSEITDLLDMDSSKSNELILSLEKAGAIERFSNGGSGFYMFKVTDFGKTLPTRIKENEILEGVDETGIKILEHVRSKSMILADELSKETGLNSMALATILNSLVRRGYLKEGGIWRRTVSITQKGNELISKYRKE